MALGLRRCVRAVHARLAGGDHRRRRRARDPGRPGVRPERGALERPLDDRARRGHEPLVPLGPGLPRDSPARRSLRLPGRERRRLGALRRPGEGPPDQWVVDARVRARLEPSAAPAGDDAVLVPRERPVPLPAHPGGRVLDPAREGRPRRDARGRLQRARRAPRLDAVVPDVRPQPARPDARCSRRRDGGARLRRRPAEGRRAPLRRRGPRRARELPARPHPVARQPPRLVEQGARVLPPAPARRRGRRGAERRVVAGRAPERRRLARRGADREVRPVHDDRLPDERVGALLGRRPPGRDLVREARPLVDRPAPVRPLVQPGGAAAVGGEDRLRHLRPGRRAVLRARREAPRDAHRPRRRSAPARHARRAGAAARRGARLEARRMRAGARQDDAEARARRARLHRRVPQVALARPARRAARVVGEGHPAQADRRDRRAACRERRARRAPGADPRRPHVRGDPRAFRRLERAAGGRGLPRAGEAHGDAPRRHRRGARRRSHHVRRHAGAAAQGARLAGVVGDGVARPPLQPVHDQRRARRPVQDAHRASAALRRARLDARVRRGPAHLPPAAQRPRRRGRAALGRPDAQGAPPPLAEPPLEVVDPLGVPGQPPHAHPLPRRAGRVDLGRGRRGDRGRRQRLGRGLQPQRRRRPRGRSSRTASHRASG